MVSIYISSLKLYILFFNAQEWNNASKSQLCLFVQFSSQWLPQLDEKVTLINYLLCAWNCFYGGVGLNHGIWMGYEDEHGGMNLICADSMIKFVHYNDNCVKNEI